MDATIHTEDLQKSYGSTHALRGVNLTVPTGTVLGVLGHNGAGKTTLVRILATLLDPTSGRAQVAGFDVRHQRSELRRTIGLTGQYAALDARLSGRENLVLVGTLQHLGRRTARARAAELLDRFGLTDAAERRVGTYSGGMRRRLDLATSLVTHPSVLFLDEPTTGLDPESRLELWSMVRAQVAQGVTVLLTTQYLEEADRLADRVAVMSDGRVIADGSPDELKSRLGGERLRVTFENTTEAARAAHALQVALGQAPTTDATGMGLSAELPAGSRSVADAATALAASGCSSRSFVVDRPTLDDVFLALTRKDRDMLSSRADEFQGSAA